MDWNQLQDRDQMRRNPLRMLLDPSLQHTIRPERPRWRYCILEFFQLLLRSMIGYEIPDPECGIGNRQFLFFDTLPQ